MTKPFLLQTAPNGLQVMLVPRTGTEAVTVEWFFRAGSRYETPKTSGLTHFIEHMVFKGGERYPTFQAVNDAVNQVGGYFNAYTSSEVTAFYIKVAADKVAVALDVLSDILTTPKYDQAELDKERGVIIEEINMHKDDLPWQTAELLQGVMYPNHPLGRPTIGTKHNVKTFPRQLFRQEMKQHFTPDRGIVTVTGKQGARIGQVLEDYIGRFDGSSKITPPPAAIDQTRPRFKLGKRDSEQTHLSIALHGPPLTDRKASIRLDVLAMILGGNTSSRLFTEVRERQGLAYAVSASGEQLTDIGSLDVYAGVSNEKADKALVAILNELKRLRDGDLTEEDLTIGKESLKGTRALRWEESAALGTLYGLQQLLLGEVMTTHDIMRAIDAVTKDEIVALARELVTDDRLNVALVGPHKEEKFTKHLTFK